MSKDQTCVIIGASHAGVNCAFTLRKEGWEGRICLFDMDPQLPYHRPPLSKTYLTEEGGFENYLLKSQESYEKANIELNLAVEVSSINADQHLINTTQGDIHYDKLVLATGARPLIPKIDGILESKDVYPLRRIDDVERIRQAVERGQEKSVLIVGGGYIGLETAATLRKLGASVTVLEREERILARVTAPELSHYFLDLHRQNGVEIITDKEVSHIHHNHRLNQLKCTDGSVYDSEIVIVGVGIQINDELARSIGLEINDGIRVDETGKTSRPDIYAIGDCTNHFNPHYNRYIRLESVQNAVDQAKVAAAAIAGKTPKYDSIPWFWSDQYDTKLQMVGLSEGFSQAIIRKETDDPDKFSIWYFKGNELLAVDAVNHAKAYVVGTKIIKSGSKINKELLIDPAFDLKPQNLIE